MSQVVRTSLNCPKCGQSFTAIIEQIIDVGRDPQAKARFLSGRVNMISCPNCGHTMGVGTPLLYHDPSKELLLIYVPMELNISQQERERVIGDLTRRLIDSIPQEQRRGYLLQPRQALTLPGMIDTILDADGITAEVREAQREKLRVIEMFLQVSPDQWPALAQEQNAYIDPDLLQMVVAAAQNAAETGKEPMANALLTLYNFLLQNTPTGQHIIEAVQTQEAVMQEVAGRLQALGERINRADFMDLVIEYAGDEDRLHALVTLIRPAFDYTFFQELTAQIEDTAGEDREELIALRDHLLDLTAALDQQTQAVLKRAADTLRVLISSEDLDAAIRPRLDQIDDAFLAVLQANLHAAEQNNDRRTAQRLKEVLAKVLEIIRESAPPQIRLVNEVLTLDDDEEARALLEAQAPQFGTELLEIMDAVADDLDENEQPGRAKRLRALRRYAAAHISGGS